MTEVKGDKRLFISFPVSADDEQPTREVIKAEEILRALWNEGFSAGEISYIGELLRDPGNWDFPLKDGPGGAGPSMVVSSPA